MPCPQDKVAEVLGIPPIWPGVSSHQLSESAARQKTKSASHTDLAETLKDGRMRQSDYLRGAAGDARHQLLSTMIDYAYDASDHYKRRYDAATGYQAAVYSMKHQLTAIHDAALKDYNANGANNKALIQVITTYQGEVDQVAAQGLEDAAAVSTPQPPPKPPTSHGGIQCYDNKTHPDQQGNGNNPTTTPVKGGSSTDQGIGSSSQADPGTTGNNGIGSNSQADPGATGIGSSSQADPGATGNNGIGSNSQADPGATGLGNNGIDSSSQADPVQPGGLAGLPGAGGAQSGGGRPGSSGSSKAPSMPSMPSMPGGGSGGMPSMGGLPGGGDGGLSSAGSGLGSAGSGLSGAGGLPGGDGGLGSVASSGGAVQPAATAFPGTSQFSQALGGSGLGSSGALPPAAPLTPLASQSVPMSAQPMPPVASAPAPTSAASAADPGSFDGGGSMMPPVGGMAGGGGPTGGVLPPYNPAGAGGQVPSVPTSAASAGVASGAGAAAATGGGGQGPGGSAAPVVASSSGGVAAGMLPQEDVNPDLVDARRLLEGLVRGTEASGDDLVLTWAVSVLQTASGPRTVVASSMGGGEYVPAGVFLPTGVRVAVRDFDLPMGWAAQFMGWPTPVDVVLAHAEAATERIAGVRISAIATSDPYCAKPPGVTDFVAVSGRDILRGSGPTPVLDGWHQHRLAGVEPTLAQRIAGLDRGPSAVGTLAAQISAQVVRAAEEQSLVNSADVDVLVKIGDGRPVDWAAHFRGVLDRDNHAVWLPDAAARAIDLDDAPASVATRDRYQRFYRMGRLVELVRCWRHQPVSVADIAYCAVLAGFGPQVAAVVTHWEASMRPGAGSPA
ncbi:nucleoporin FG repeat-containing protein [Mycolicibacter acidiphilus]|nr:nucleoporin [Mycolicibacter acidiphilus]